MRLIQRFQLSSPIPDFDALGGLYAPTIKVGHWTPSSPLTCTILGYGRYCNSLSTSTITNSKPSMSDITDIAENVGSLPDEHSHYPNETSSDSTDSAIRYAAYANRLRTILQASHRYVAYTSDIGESFRPVAHPKLVTVAYGVSWAYLIGDVSYESWKAKMRQEGRYKAGLKPWDPVPLANPIAAQMYGDMDWKLMGVKRAIFQSIASMGLPAFTIHSTVRYSSYLFKNSTNKTLKNYGPVGLGLAVVPFLPYIFDEPVEEGVDYVFAKLFPPSKKLV